MIHFPITSPTLIFFVVLLIILFAPIIMGKLRIPHIIGMVLAGVVMGQYGQVAQAAGQVIHPTECRNFITLRCREAESAEGNNVCAVTNSALSASKRLCVR